MLRKVLFLIKTYSAISLSKDSNISICSNTPSTSMTLNNSKNQEISKVKSKV